MLRAGRPGLRRPQGPLAPLSGACAGSYRWSRLLGALRVGDPETVVQEAVGWSLWQSRAFAEAAVHAPSTISEGGVSLSLCLQPPGSGRGCLGVCVGRAFFGTRLREGWHAAAHLPASPCLRGLWGRRGRTCRPHWDGSWKGPELEGILGSSQQSAPCCFSPTPCFRSVVNALTMSPLSTAAPFSQALRVVSTLQHVRPFLCSLCFWFYCGKI